METKKTRVPASDAAIGLQDIDMCVEVLLYSSDMFNKFRSSGTVVYINVMVGMQELRN